MAEGDINIPKVGSLPKKVVIPLALGIAAFIGWRVYQSRTAATDTTDTTVTDGDFGAVDSSIPGVLGAVSPTNSYGSGDTGSTSGGDGTTPGSFTTNAAWTTYVTNALDAAYDYADIAAALGNYLGSQPLSTAQQTIVRAAIAVGGYPPVGSFSIIPGGNTDLTVAPSGLKTTAVGQTSVTIAFTPVPGATEYRAYRGVGVNVAASHGSPIIIAGLSPNTDYTVTIQGLTASGKYSPSSAPLKFKTAAYGLAKPGTPTVSSITKTSAVVKTGAVAHADGYRWYINGQAHGYSEAPSYTVSGLAANHAYNVSVAADLAHQNPGPTSATRKFTTKK